MRTQIAETSLQAFRSFDPDDLQKKEKAVMALFVGAEVPLSLTREQIAGRLNWKESAVCGRVNSLVEKGWLQEVAGGITRSGRSAMLVRLPVIEQ